MTTDSLLQNEVVSSQEWLRAHAEFLAEEKELTKRSDALSLRRRALPWTRVEKGYPFVGPKGSASLADLFAGRSQLATYHFMFGPDWKEGCPSCSFVADHLNGMVEHLQARDITLVLVSRAPYERLAPFAKRLGWRIPWFSSGGSDFNHDFRVSFSKEDVAAGVMEYNLGSMPPYSDENPGLTFFYQDPSGAIFRTYSMYARGVESLLGTYQVLDRAPKGRDEANLPSSMSWVRYHDQYEPTLHGIEPCSHNQACH